MANLTAPIFIETLLIMLLGAVDTVMLSQYSDNTVAAVGVVNQLLNLVFLIFGVTTAGTSVLCSQYLGAGQSKNMLQVLGLSILFNAAVGIVCSAALYWGANRMLSLMELRPELIHDGLSYMRIVGGGAFLQAVSLTLSAVLRSANKAYYPMMVTLIINILNIFGNYALIFGKFGFPQLGAEGAAISTTFSRSVAMLLLFFLLFRKLVRKIPFAYFRPFPMDKFKNLMSIGLPSAGEQISYSLSQVVITYFINMLGNEALTARTYAMNIIMFTYLFSMALGQGGGICIGHLIGERKNRAALALGRFCLKWSIIISIGMALFFCGNGPDCCRIPVVKSRNCSDDGYRIDDRCGVGAGTGGQYFLRLCITVGRRCQLSLYCRTYCDVELCRWRRLPFRYYLPLGIGRDVVGLYLG